MWGELLGLSTRTAAAALGDTLGQTIRTQTPPGSTTSISPSVRDGAISATAACLSAIGALASVLGPASSYPLRSNHVHAGEIRQRPRRLTSEPLRQLSAPRIKLAGADPVLSHRSTRPDVGFRDRVARNKLGV